jgi:putative chitinase
MDQKTVTLDEMKQLGWKSINEDNLKELNNCLRTFDISTFKRLTHILPQVSHESGCGKYTKEISDGKQYENRTNLGNTQPGDGPKYKGASYLELI